MSRLHVILEGECVGQAAPMASLPTPAPAVQQSAPAQSYGSYGAPPATTTTYQQPPSVPQSYGAPAAAPSSGYGSTKPAPGSYGGPAANNRPVVRDDNAGGAIMPINAINPYSSR
jgi:hypothetical protein